MDDKRFAHDLLSKGLWGRLSSLWPALPFLGFGSCIAWVTLLRSGVWMSVTEVNGDAVTSLSLTIDFATALTLFIVIAFRSFVQRYCSPRCLVVVAGISGAIGSLLFVLTGPYYGPVVFAALGNPKWLLSISGALCGVSLGLFYLIIGVRYCMLPFRYAILYLSYSNIVAVVVYLAVIASPDWALIPGGPTIVTIASFVLLPIATTILLVPRLSMTLWSACCSPSYTVNAQTMAENATLEGKTPSEQFLRLYGKLLFALTVFALVCAGVTVATIANAQPALLQSQYNLLMLLRLPLLFVMSVGAITIDAKAINYSKLCLAAIIALEACVVIAMAVDSSNQIWFDLVQLVNFIFGFLIWALVFAVGSTHKSAASIIVALGFGFYAFGNAAGSVAGLALGGLVSFLSLDLVFAIMLLPTFVAVGEKDLDELISFDSDATAPETLDEALGRKITAKTMRTKGSFSMSLDRYASLHRLTTREAETLRYLVAGRGDNQIAEAMGVSYNTARTHVRNVYAKCDVHSRQELIDIVNTFAREN